MDFYKIFQYFEEKNIFALKSIDKLNMDDQKIKLSVKLIYRNTAVSNM